MKVFVVLATSFCNFDWEDHSAEVVAVCLTKEKANEEIEEAFRREDNERTYHYEVLEMPVIG